MIALVFCLVGSKFQHRPLIIPNRQILFCSTSISPSYHRPSCVLSALGHSAPTTLCMLSLVLFILLLWGIFCIKYLLKNVFLWDHQGHVIPRSILLSRRGLSGNVIASWAVSGLSLCLHPTCSLPACSCRASWQFWWIGQRTFPCLICKYILQDKPWAPYSCLQRLCELKTSSLHAHLASSSWEASHPFLRSCPWYCPVPVTFKLKCLLSLFPVITIAYFIIACTYLSLLEVKCHGFWFVNYFQKAWYRWDQWILAWTVLLFR